AKVRRDWSGTHVEDLESRNGIRVNKKRIKGATLKSQDELEIGNVRLLYLDPSAVGDARRPEEDSSGSGHSQIENTNHPALVDDVPELPPNPVVSDAPSAAVAN